MIKTPCPICDKHMRDHDEKEIEKCLWEFVRESKNPVVYTSRKKRICPICEKEMLDHNTSETRVCVKQFVDDVESLEL